MRIRKLVVKRILTLALVASLAGCSLPESTVKVSSETEASTVVSKALDGPDARTIVVLDGAGTLFTLEKSGEGVEISFPGNKPTISTTVAELKVTLSKDHLKACESNLKNIATALEMWSADNSGNYPSKLSKVTPDYLKELPTCPASDEASYTYERTGDLPGYVITCAGDHHKLAGVPADHPQYNSTEGLVRGSEQ